MDTPSLSHFGTEDFKYIYEPAEDTFLLLDAIETDLEMIRNRKPTLCLEVGSGSGCVITAVARVLGTSAFYIGTDINPRACAATKSTALNNSANVEVVKTNLVLGLEQRLQQSVDLLLFNPPYVVTPSTEVGGQDITAAWAGGINGREVIDKFLPAVPLLLSRDGLCYLIALKENDISYIENQMLKYNLQMSIIVSRRCGSEHLLALRFSWK